MHLWKHFKTVVKHRAIVRRGCFRVGLYRQGLTHDLSKYSPTEFLAGAKYYLGVRSPNVAQREAEGYSESWMHHKGRNRHHFEYWSDLQKGKFGYQYVPMPLRYVIESVMDRIAASRVYKGADYYPGHELDYLQNSLEAKTMHPDTLALLTELLTVLRDGGEEALYARCRELLRAEKKK